MAWPKPVVLNLEYCGCRNDGGFEKFERCLVCGHYGYQHAKKENGRICIAFKTKVGSLVNPRIVTIPPRVRLSILIYQDKKYFAGILRSRFGLDKSLYKLLTVLNSNGLLESPPMSFYLAKSKMNESED